MDMVEEIDRHIKKNAALYEPGILKPEKHQRLVDALPHVCEISGVRKEFVARSAKDFCGPAEMAWVNGFRENSDKGISGMYYLTTETKQVEQRMMALAGACLRNYINARVMTLGDVLAEVDSGYHDDPSALFIPNFCLTSKEYQLSQWDASAVYDLLLHRYTRSLQTVIGIFKLEVVEQIYGLSCKDHIENYYTKA
jgi:hypothetical protein